MESLKVCLRVTLSMFSFLGLLPGDVKQYRNVISLLKIYLYVNMCR